MLHNIVCGTTSYSSSGEKISPWRIITLLALENINYLSVLDTDNSWFPHVSYLMGLRYHAMCNKHFNVLY